MIFWFLCLLVDLLAPMVAIVFGLKFRKAPPKNVNSLFAYRTARSMKDHQSWVAAHNLFGNILFKMGLVMIPLSLISMLFVIKENITIIGMSCMTLCLLQCVALTLTTIPVELLLKRREEKLQQKNSDVSNVKKLKKKKRKK
jgi:uncharacterized membrane protein